MKPGALPFFQFASPRLHGLVRAKLLCAFDFDGTLAPIVTNPDDARTPSDVLQRMRDLSALAPVAVITGRSLADIGARLDFTPDYLVGNHGLEGLQGSPQLSGADKQLCLGWEQAIATALNDKSLFDPHIWIENKGYSLSVHYRLASDWVKAEARLADVIARLEPPARMVGGKCVLNVLPPAAADKGVALERLMAASGAAGAIFVGDDVTDEDVFRLRRKDLLSVRIGGPGDSAADFFLEQRQDIIPLLDELIRRLRKANTAGDLHN